MIPGYEISQRHLDILNEVTHRRNNPAEVLYGQLLAQILCFEESLTEDQEIGAYFVATPLNAVAISSVTYQNPNMLVFIGQDSEGRPHRVVQHCTQLSVSFCAIKKQKATDQPRRIGFVLWENFVGDDEG